MFDQSAETAVVNDWLADLRARGDEVAVRYRFHTFPAVRVSLPAGSPLTATSLAGDQRVRYVGGRRPVILDAVPDDPYFDNQWALANDGSLEGYRHIDIDAVRAWDYVNNDTTIVIAMADRGFNIYHPDLAANCMTGFSFVTSDTFDTVFVDSTMVEYGQWYHGTKVASVIAAIGDNSSLMTGVCWGVRILPFRCYELNDYICAIDSAAAYGADVMNNSWHVAPHYEENLFPDLEMAITRATSRGVIMVNSAGNAQHNIDLPVNRIYPASYDLPLNLAVTAFASDGSLIYNWGENTVDIAAPGFHVCALSHLDTTAVHCGNGGTSYAAPHVAGALALIKSRYPGISSLGAVDRLLTSAEFAAAGVGRVAGARRLNLYRALGDIDPVAPADPADLRVVAVTPDSVTVSWTMPGEDGYTGTAEYYEIWLRNPIVGLTSQLVVHEDSPPPGGSAVLHTMFPHDDNKYLLTLAVYDQDRNSSTTTISLHVPPAPAPPRIELSEDYVAVDLLTGQARVDSIFVTNQGGSDLLAWPVVPASYSWLDVTPATLSVAPGDSAAFRFRFDASGWCSPGVAGPISIDSNDPATPSRPCVAHMAVRDTCQIDTDSTVIDFGDVALYANADTSLSLANIGCSDLQVRGIDFTVVSGYLATPRQFIVQAGDSVRVQVSHYVDRPGPFAATMVIASNDPFAGYLYVPVSGNGVDKPRVGEPPRQDIAFRCAPNPANPQTTFACELARAARVVVRVYDLRGDLVRQLDGGRRPAGPNTIGWDGKDGHGDPSPSGLYLCRLSLDGDDSGRTVKICLIQ